MTILSSRRLWGLVRLVLTVAAGVWIALRIDAAKLWGTLVSSDASWVATAAVLTAAATLFSAQASRESLSALGVRLRYLDILRINYEAFYYSFLGEIVGGARRWHGLGGADKRGREALAAMLIERLQQLLIYGGLLGAVTVLVPAEIFGALGVKAVHSISAAACGVSACGLWALCGGLLLRLPRVGPWLSPEETSLAPLREGALARSTFWMGFQSAVGFAAYLAVFEAAGIQAGFGGTLWAFALAGLVQVLPLTLFGLGLREGALVFALSGLGVAPERAVAAGLLMFAVTVLLGSVGGILAVAPPRKTVEST
ncbi:MAG: hypothetical protein MOGMAGMI_00013 [Candidatus Omnitrophica bacterium]|nr:hypothetical protein [Candidatus Omnitrophota bacterium]